MTDERFYDHGSQRKLRLSFGHRAKNDNNILYTSYRFLEVMDLSALPQEDVDYLTTKGCMKLPPRPLLDEFITAYFQYVHPLLPLLDEEEFFASYSDEADKECANPISLFVFQAILFAGGVVRLFYLGFYVLKN
jgi:hypothetical protein